MLETPVAFLIFNRPDLTARVFEQIAAVKPSRLLVIADGPRTENEAVLCQQARAVVGKVDWPCEISRNYSEVNLGCKKRVSSGLDWVFENVERAIILEDDCLPHPDFFMFCETMLARYENDERVMHVSGDQFVPGLSWKGNYGFSRYIHVWGWATWRRSWEYYDVEMNEWPVLRANILASCFDESESQHWDEFFGSIYAGHLDTWDGQWNFACWAQSGLAVVPRVNLISNIGFRADATHTSHDSPHANMQTWPWENTNCIPNFLMAEHSVDGLDRDLWIAKPQPRWKRAPKRFYRLFKTVLRKL